MNRRSVSSFLPTSNRIRTSLCLILLVLLVVTPIDIIAEPVEPIDVCIGVDHPPFEEDYPGDGYSYLRIGVTMPLEYYDEGALFEGELTGGGSSVTASDMLNADGQLFMNFPLYSYGDYVITVYDDMGDMVFEDDVTVDDSEPACDKEGLATSPPKEEPVEVPEETPEETPDTTDETSDEPTDETTEEPTEEPTDEPSDETPESTDPKSEEPTGVSWWPLILVGGGVLIAIIGLLILLKKNCEKERQAWLAASAAAADASDKAREAEAEAEKLTEEREQLEEELDDIRETYPSAGREGGEEAWVEMDGRRITSRDVAMRREAERAAWDKYRSDPNPESAEELVEDWEEAATPKSEEERRELDEEAKALEDAIKKAKDAEKEALDKAKDAKDAEDKAKEKEEAARRIYEECMKAALAPPKPKPEPKPDEPGTAGDPPTGPSVAEGEDEAPCCKDDDPPQERNRRNLGSIRIPVKLEVNLEGGGAHEGAKAAKEISDELADASEKLGWISKAMDLKGIGEALVRDGVGWSLAGAAAPPAAGQALDMPTPTSPGQLAVDTLSILGKISSVIIGKVPELQERRLPDCDVQGTFRYNVYKAECVEIWVCRNGQWVKDRARFTLTLISKSSGRMTKRRALTWAQAQRLIRRYEQMFRGRLATALDRLAELEAGCK